MVECQKCKVKKLASKFSKNSSHQNGLQKICKKCNGKYRVANKERIAEQKRAYYRTSKGIAKQLFDKARYRARKQSIVFELDYDWVLGQVQQVLECPVRKVKFVTGDKTFHNNSRTLDRAQPSLGYTRENTCLVSFKANLVKNNGSLQDLKLLICYLHKIKAMKAESWIGKFRSLGLVQQKIYFEEKNNKRIYRKSISVRMLSDAKKRAKRKKLICSLVECDIVVPTVCPIIGIPLFKGTRKKIDNSPTLDRIDNNLGYVLSNIQVISNKANIMKNDCTLQELEQIYIGFEAIEVTKNRLKHYGVIQMQVPE